MYKISRYKYFLLGFLDSIYLTVEKRLREREIFLCFTGRHRIILEDDERTQKIFESYFKIRILPEAARNNC